MHILGLFPQSAGVVGGYKVQGKTAEAAQQLIEDARHVKRQERLWLFWNVFHINLARRSFSMRFDSGNRHWGGSGNGRSSACFP